MIPRKLAGLLRGSSSEQTQRGFGNGWMLLTIGMMVGFVTGFVLFLSRLPEAQYTLVETERAIEKYSAGDTRQYEYIDRLSEKGSAVPRYDADNMPAFESTRSQVRYGTGANERQPAVKIAEELYTDNHSVQPVEIAATGGATTVVAGGVQGGGRTTATAISKPVSSADNIVGKKITRQSVVKKIPAPHTTAYYLQAGAFSKGAEAKRMQEKLSMAGMDAFVRTVAVSGKQLHRVRIGPFYDSDSLYAAQTRLGRNGISYLVIRVQG